MERGGERTAQPTNHWETKLRVKASQQTAARHFGLDCTIYIDVCVDGVTQLHFIKRLSLHHLLQLHSLFAAVKLVLIAHPVPQDEEGSWHMDLTNPSLSRVLYC